MDIALRNIIKSSIKTAAQHNIELSEREKLKITNRYERVDHFVTDIRRSFNASGVLRNNTYLRGDLFRLLCEKSAWYDVLSPMEIHISRPMSSYVMPTSEELKDICEEIASELEPVTSFSSELKNLNDLLENSVDMVHKAATINRNADLLISDLVSFLD